MVKAKVNIAEDEEWRAESDLRRLWRRRRFGAIRNDWRKRRRWRSRECWKPQPWPAPNQKTTNQPKTRIVI